MRRIAAELGTGAMSLYKYVRTKDDLVDLMDDAVMGELLIPDEEFPADWRAAIMAIARRSRDAFVRHPWAVYSLQGSMPGPNALRHGEQSFAALSDAPLMAGQKLELLAVIDEFVLGHALRVGELRGRAAMDPGSVEAVMEAGRAELSSGRYPHTEAFLGGADARDRLAQLTGPERDEARFERGLQALIDGATSPAHG